MHTILCIHEILDRASETKSWERYSVHFHCMIRGDGNDMMSIYSGVCQIYTPPHSVHLCYPCPFLQPLSLVDDVLGGRDRASLEMHLETAMEGGQRCTRRPGSSEFGDALGDQEIK
jgi:hypothetical protein